MASDHRYDFKAGLGYRLSRAAKILQTTADAKLRESGLTRLRWLIMSSVEFEGIRSPTQIANHIRVERTAVSRMISQLERDGFLEKRRSAQDGRSSVITATAKGSATCLEVSQTLRAAISVHLHGLSEEQIDLLGSLLDKIDPGDAEVWTTPE